MGKKKAVKKKRVRKGKQKLTIKKGSNGKLKVRVKAGKQVKKKKIKLKVKSLSGRKK